MNFAVHMNLSVKWKSGSGLFPSSGDKDFLGVTYAVLKSYHDFFCFFLNCLAESETAQKTRWLTGELFPLSVSLRRPFKRRAAGPESIYSCAGTERERRSWPILLSHSEACVFSQADIFKKVLTIKLHFSKSTHQEKINLRPVSAFATHCRYMLKSASPVAEGQWHCLLYLFHVGLVFVTPRYLVEKLGFSINLAYQPFSETKKDGGIHLPGPQVRVEQME